MIDSLTNRTLSTYTLFELVSHVRNTVSKTPDDIDPVVYWKSCALLEMGELVREFPVENWKPKTTLDETAIKFEVVDVVCHLVASLLEDGQSIESDCPHGTPTLDVAIGLRSSHKIADHHVMRLYLDISRQVVSEKFNITDLSIVIRHLCVIGDINYSEFSAAFVAKMALVSVRLLDGKYRDNWNKISKDNLSQEDVLEQIVSGFNRCTDAPLSDLYNRVVNNTEEIFVY